jgi:hypothetical protein
MIVHGKYVDLDGNPIGRSDLDKKVDNVLQTAEDIRCLYYASENMDEDQMANALLGLEIFARMRAEELIECVKQVNHNERIAEEEIQSYLR